jgi:hypothetical protein
MIAATCEHGAMTKRYQFLRRTIANLAAPAEAQLDYLANLFRLPSREQIGAGFCVDELALEFDDMYLTAGNMLNSVKSLKRRSTRRGLSMLCSPAGAARNIRNSGLVKRCSPTRAGRRSGCVQRRCSKYIPTKIVMAIGKCSLPVRHRQMSQ